MTSAKNLLDVEIWTRKVKRFMMITRREGNKPK